MKKNKQIRLSFRNEEIEFGGFQAELEKFVNNMNNET